MAMWMGRLGAVYAPNGTTDLVNVPLAQVGTTSEYVIADPDVRIVRAFLETATENDFTLSSGTVVGLKKPVGGVLISGGTPPYTLSSTNGQVATLVPIGGFLDWRLDIDQVLVDVTTLGDAHRVHERIVRGWEASAGRFWIDETFTVDVLGGRPGIGDAPFVVSFFVNTESANRYRYVGFAEIEGVSIEAAAAGMVQEGLRFTGHGPLYFRRATD